MKDIPCLGKIHRRAILLLAYKERPKVCSLTTLETLLGYIEGDQIVEMLLNCYEDVDCNACFQN